MSLSVLVSDATNVIGRLLVSELGRRNRPVRVLVRTPEEGRQWPSGEVEVIEGTFRDAAALDRALDGVGCAVLLSGPTPDQVVRHGSIVEAAERTGRSVHLVSIPIMGAVPADAPLQLARWHAVTDAQIRSSGLPATTLRPQLLMQNLLRTAASIRNDNMICGSFGLARLPQIDARDVTAAAVRVLSTPGYEGRSYDLTGPQALSYAEIAALLSEELGRSIHYVDMPTEAYHEYLVGEGMASWRADDLAALARLFRTGLAWPVTSAVTELTGRPARTFRQFVREHAGAFRPHEETVSPVNGVLVNGVPVNGSTVSCATPL